MGHERDDATVFAELYPSLRRFAGAICPAGAAPDDLVQEAVTRTLARRSLADLEEPRAYLCTAMVRIASNLARGSRRRDLRARRVGGGSAEPLDAYPSDLADLLRIPPRARAVLYVTIVEGGTFREAADLIGCSEAAARQIASRALRQLRVEMEPELRRGDVV